jgi:hypothetical protein
MAEYNVYQRVGVEGLREWGGRSDVGVDGEKKSGQMERQSGNFFDYLANGSFSEVVQFHVHRHSL